MAKREIKTLEDLAAYFERRARENFKRVKTEEPDIHSGKALAYQNAALQTRKLIEKQRSPREAKWNHYRQEKILKGTSCGPFHANCYCN